MATIGVADTIIHFKAANTIGADHRKRARAILTKDEFFNTNPWSLNPALFGDKSLLEDMYRAYRNGYANTIPTPKVMVHNA